MIQQLANPSALLSPFVKQYWGMVSCKQEGGCHVQRIVPSGLFELIFYLEDPAGRNTEQTALWEGDHDLRAAKGFF